SLVKKVEDILAKAGDIAAKRSLCHSFQLRRINTPMLDPLIRQEFSRLLQELGSEVDGDSPLPLHYEATQILSQLVGLPDEVVQHLSPNVGRHLLAAARLEGQRSKKLGQRFCRGSRDHELPLCGGCLENAGRIDIDPVCRKRLR